MAQTHLETWSITRKEPIDEAIDNILFCVTSAEDVTGKIGEKLRDCVKNAQLTVFSPETYRLAGNKALAGSLMS